MENVTRTSDHAGVLQQTLGEASTQADLLENIWKLESLFQNHSSWLQRLEILIKVTETPHLVLIRRFHLLETICEETVREPTGERRLI